MKLVLFPSNAQQLIGLEPKLKRGEYKQVLITCPVCKVLGIKTEFKASLPVKAIMEKEGGITPIHVEPLCKHHFGVFIDKNFRIRGYQETDFSLKETKEKSSSEA